MPFDMDTIIKDPLISPIWQTELSYASPVIRPRPRSLFEPQPPPARSCRSNGSSSDESPVPASDGFLETPLRAGGPRLCESPCETLHNIPPGHANYDLLQGRASFELLTLLGDICRAESVQYREMSFVGRRSTYEPNAGPIATLFILAARSQGSASWLDLSRKLYSYLRIKALEGVSVEIVDPEFTHCPRIHPCLPSDAIFPIWMQLVTDIFDCVDRTGVFSIGCFRIGSSDERLECTPTVLLGVDREVQREWKVLRDVVVAILDKNKLGSVSVTIRKDNKITRDGSPGDDSPGVLAGDCRPDPRLGTSLSPRSLKDGHGTLGGWVELLDPESGDWLPFALTCSQCCFPREDGLSQNDLEVVQRWKSHGVYPPDMSRDRLLEVDSPSYRDLNEGVMRAEKNLKALESESEYCHISDLKSQDEFVMPHQERKWKAMCKDIAIHMKEHQEIKTFFQTTNHRLGTVFAASGLREVKCTTNSQELSIRDWALVQPRRPRCAGTNRVKLPPSAPRRTLKQLESFTTALPEMEEQLFKIGRATGYTNGTYGNLKTCYIVRKTVNGKIVEIPTFEHTIVRPGHTVVQEGDSGSLVFSLSGAVRGMIVGGNGSYDVGYFTATSDLLADIKTITRAKEVRLRYIEED